MVGSDPVTDISIVGAGWFGKCNCVAPEPTKSTRGRAVTYEQKEGIWIVKAVQRR